jgi:hypothetical protein
MKMSACRLRLDLFLLPFFGMVMVSTLFEKYFPRSTPLGM